MKGNLHVRFLGGPQLATAWGLPGDGIGCDEFIFVPVKPDIAQLDGLAEIVC